MEIWDTPGGRRWSAPIRTALDRGTCVIVCHPAAERPAGLVDRVARWCSERRPTLQRLTVDADIVRGDRVGNVELVARDVAQVLNLDVDVGARITPADIATHELTDGAVIHVDARRIPDDAASTWCRFAAAVAEGTKDHPAADRCAVIVHVTAGVGVGVPDSDTNLRVLWWWGALSPLDVTVLIDEIGRQPMDTATIVEVARWDVDLAERLATRWDGAPDTLVDHLRVTPPVNVPEANGPAGPAPGPMREAWVAGLIESWEGRRDRHASLIDSAALDRRRWHAQVRVIYPWLEELRADVASVVSDLGLRAGLHPDVVADLAASELGPLRHLACFEHRLRLPRPVRDTLDRAVTARNSLAHLSPVDPATLTALAAAARAARCTPGPLL